MPRLLILNRFFFPDVSATSQIVSDLAFFMAEQGWQVCVITSRLRYDDPRDRFTRLEVVRGVRIRRVWSSAPSGERLVSRMVAYLSFFVSSMVALLGETRKGDVILATTDPPMISVVGAIVARVRHARLVNWLQDVFPEVAMALGVRGLSGPVAVGLIRARNWSLIHAKANVAIGQLMARRIGDLLGDRDRIHTVPNWALEWQSDRMPGSADEMRVAWGLDGCFVVGYSGNLGRAHSWQPIFAVAEALSRRTDIRFLFIGGGVGMRELEAKVRSAQLDNVKFLGYQPREALALTLRVPDVHLISLKPALEGLIVPSKLYGVLAAGRPVIFVGRVDGEVAQSHR